MNSMTTHKLDVARTIDGFENVLVKNLVPSPATEALFPNNGIYAGRCVNRNASGELELGVTGSRLPYWIFRTSNLPSTGLSDPTPIADQTGLTYKDGREHKVLCYAGIEGLELITTEFDGDSGTPYALNQFLTAPDATTVGGTDADKLESAGVVTNAGVVYGSTPVVGIVSESDFVKPHNINMLTFYTLFRPPVEGLPDGITEPTWG